MKLYFFGFGIVFTAVLVLQKIYGGQIIALVGGVGGVVISFVAVWENRKIKRRRLAKEKRIAETRLRLNSQLRLQGNRIVARVSNTGDHKIEKLEFAARLVVTDAGQAKTENRLTGSLSLFPLVTSKFNLPPGAVRDVTICKTTPSLSLNIPVDREPWIDGYKHVDFCAQVTKSGSWFDYIKANPTFAFLECSLDGDVNNDDLSQTARLNLD